MPGGRLDETLRHIDQIDDDLTLYVPRKTPVGPATTVVVVNEEAVAPPEGMTYLLEVSIVKDVLRVWRLWRGGSEPSDNQACEAINYYVEHDAYIPAQ